MGSYNRKRLWIGVLTLCALFSLINYLAGWNIFGRFDELAVIAFSLAIFLSIFFVGPSYKERYDYRSRESSTGTNYRIRLWKYLLPLVIVMVAIVFVGDGIGLLTGDPVPSDHWTDIAFIEFLLVVAGIFGWRRLKKLRSRDEQAD